MKPENIEERKARRKREAVSGVVLYALLELVTGVCLGGFAYCVPNLPGWAAVLLWVLAALALGSILPAILVLRTRFKEIEGGELDAAAEY